MTKAGLETFKEQNGYMIDGVWYPRVTSIVQIKHKPSLVFFYAAAENYAAANRKKTLAAKEGSAVHELLEDVLLKKAVPAKSPYRAYIQGLKEFMSQHKVRIWPQFIERRVKHSTHRYSGTFDILAEVDGAFTLLDIKTSSGIWRDYALQTSAYYHALNDEPWLIDEAGKRSVLPKAVEKRLVLRINQIQICQQCGAVKRVREMGNSLSKGKAECDHQFSDLQPDWEMQEFTEHEKDFQAFLSCKGLWEWEHHDALQQLGYL